MSRPVHFEIHAEKPDRAMAFYTQLFDWKFTQFGSELYWLIATGDVKEPGINGGLLPRRGPGPLPMAAMNAFVCTVGVADLNASLDRLATLGGEVVLPRMPIPTVGWLAYAKDTEGNCFGLMQPDVKAA